MTSNLADFQRRVAAAIMNPLTGSYDSAAKLRDGGSMRAEAAELVKPNDRLTSLERLEIYNQQYWYRILDSLHEDFPGLRAVLGERGFHRLSRAYLADCPSQSYTLRDLGARLEAWLSEHPQFVGRRLPLALDMIRLEWAHIEAFDAAERKALGPEDLAEINPGLRLSLQPYIRLLELQHPVDNVRVRVNAHVVDEHGAASNAVNERRPRVAQRLARVKPERIFLAVHRAEFTVYYRRLEPDEFQLLAFIAQGHTISSALDTLLNTATADAADAVGRVRTWFSNWSRLGWLCRPPQTD
jgi:hypothetical protein